MMSVIIINDLNVTFSNNYYIVVTYLYYNYK